MNVEIVDGIKELFAQIDAQTTSFQAATGLACPVGCGQCCLNPDVEAAPLEMLPIAIDLWQRGEARNWLDRVSSVRGTDVCVFYLPDPHVPENGRCGIYAWRPSICRLFGFAAVRNKQGELALAACKRHKETIPETVVKANEAIANGIPVPAFSDFSRQLANLDPGQGQTLLPINQALQVALEKVGLIGQFGNFNSEGDAIAGNQPT